MCAPLAVCGPTKFYPFGIFKAMERPVTVGVTITIIWIGLGFFGMQFLTIKNSSTIDLVLNFFGLIFPLVLVWIAVGLSLRIKKTRARTQQLRDEIEAHKPKDE